MNSFNSVSYGGLISSSIKFCFCFAVFMPTVKKLFLLVVVGVLVWLLMETVLMGRW